MEVLLTLLALLLVGLPALAFLAFYVPVHTWTFPWHGREVVVRNFLFHETVSIDGEAQTGTRLAGDHLTYAEHRVEVGGRALTVTIRASLGFGCVALEGGQVVFASDGALQPSPVVVAPAAPFLADPRWEAAQTLLRELLAAADAEVVGDARGLRGRLEAALRDLDAAREASAAHLALGGEADSTLVDLAEARVQEIVETLRDLHRLHALSTISSDDAGMRELRARVDARREVEAVRRAARARAGREPDR